VLKQVAGKKGGTLEAKRSKKEHSSRRCGLEKKKKKGKEEKKIIVMGGRKQESRVAQRSLIFRNGRRYARGEDSEEERRNARHSWRNDRLEGERRGLCVR